MGVYYHGRILSWAYIIMGVYYHGRMQEVLVEVSELKREMPRSGISSAQSGEVNQLGVWWCPPPPPSGAPGKTLEICFIHMSQRVTGYGPCRITYNNL